MIDIHRGGRWLFFLRAGKKECGDQEDQKGKDKVFGRNLSDHVGKIFSNSKYRHNKAQGIRHKAEVRKKEKGGRNKGRPEADIGGGGAFNWRVGQKAPG
ncbi:MAG TPA: hypothetical protein DCP74_02550 [Bacteroidales bacterium]|nr:hypothetical protein [Bacteroidales bacterium]